METVDAEPDGKKAEAGIAAVGRKRSKRAKNFTPPFLLSENGRGGEEMMKEDVLT